MKAGDLSGVSTTARCTKPSCKLRTLNRHHKRHEYMFVSSFVRRRMRETVYRAFVKRYYEFRKEDVSYICLHHHAEIHLMYDKIIRKDLRSTHKALRNYSWNQANHLMDKLEAAFNDWIEKVTPGEDPEILISGKGRGTKGGFQKAVASMKSSLIPTGN